MELIPGRSKKTYQDGDTIPLSRATPNAPELEDVLSTFAPRTRDDARKSLEGFGDSIAGRGEAINTTIRELEPFTRYLLPVMRNLSSRKTELKGFFPGLGAAAAQVAPVAKVQAEWLVEHGHDLRRHLARPGGAPRDDLGEPADAAGGDRVVPRADAVPGALRRGVARPPAGHGAAPDARSR